jgi:Recombination endonuclease VII
MLAEKSRTRRTAKGHPVAEARTLPDHEQCSRHKYYKLSCQQYEDMLAECGHACQICGCTGHYSARGKLAIDHCGPLWAVRGLLCTGCNSNLEDPARSPLGSAEYLASPWWLRQCAALGLPPRLGEEPGIGSAIRNQFGIVWVHLSDGGWEASTQHGHHWTRRPWEALFDLYGPHNLVPYDLLAAFIDGSVPSDLRYAVEHGSNWGGIRAAIGAPEPMADRPEARTREWSPRDSLPWLKTPEATAAALRFFLTVGECRRVAELLSGDVVP